jgi:hypothetical protein
MTPARMGVLRLNAGRLNLLQPPSEVQVTQTLVEISSQQPGDQRTTQLGIESMFGRRPLPEFEINYSAGNLALTWVEFTDALNRVHPWSAMPLVDPQDYYYGYKEPRVISWGSISRVLSGPMGEHTGVQFSIDLSDNDRGLRALLANASTRYMLNRPLVVRMIDDRSRRVQGPPRTIMRGLVSDYGPRPNLGFTLGGEDLVTRQFMSPLAAVSQVPKRLVTAADFPSCPTDSLGKPVPIWYGLASDQQVQTRQVLVNLPSGQQQLGVEIVGGAGTTTYEYIYTVCPGAYEGLADIGPTTSDPAYDQDHRYEVALGGALVTNAPSPSEYRPGQRYVRLYWANVGEGHRGGIFPYPYGTNDCRPRIYGRTPGTVPGLLSHMGRESADNEWIDNMNAPALSTPPAFAVPPSQFETVTEDLGKGQVPVLHVGPVLVGGTEWWDEFLVCGHAVKEVEGWYFAGMREPDATEGVDYLIPGRAGYAARFGGATYQDRNGHRYTLVYARGAKADQIKENPKRLTINIKGIETVGDGSGTVIVKSLEIYLHALQNWIFGNYQAGSWLPSPVIIDNGQPTSHIDEQSFHAAQIVSEARMPVASGHPVAGYMGAGSIGADGTFVSISDLIQRLNQSCDVESGYNRQCQFFVDMLDETRFTEHLDEITDVSNIVKDSFDVVEDLTAHFNVVPYRYARDLTLTQDVTPPPEGTTPVQQPEWTEEIAQDVPSQSPQHYDMVLTMGALELHFVQEAAMARDIASRKLRRHRDPPRTIRLKVPLEGFDYELADLKWVSTFQGIGPTGWAREPFRIMKHDADPNALTVDIEGLDLSYLFAAAQREANGEPDTITLIDKRRGIPIELPPVVGQRRIDLDE